MPMPATLPLWNTDNLNRTEPSGAKKALGWIVGEPVDSSYFNWWMFTAYEWLLWLSGIEGEALSWSVVQNFEEGVTITKTGLSNALVVTGAINTAGGGAIFADGGFSSFVGATLYGYSYFESTSNVLAAIEIFKEGTEAGLIINADNEGLVVQGGLGGTGGNYAARFTNDLGAGGAIFSGGTTALGIGARFVGATGIASPGFGATFLGGSPSLGTGKAGISSVGGSNAPGGVFVAGNGASGAGIDTTGSYGVSAGGPGLIARNGLDTIGTAVDLYGSISFSNATAPASNAAQPNKLTKKSFAKAWALIDCNGTATPTIVDGINIASVSQSIAGGTNGDITINLANAMTSTDHAVKTWWQDYGGSFNRLSYPLSRTASQVVLRTAEASTGVKLGATDTQSSRVYVEWFGAQ